MAEQSLSCLWTLHPRDQFEFDHNGTFSIQTLPIFLVNNKKLTDSNYKFPWCTNVLNLHLLADNLLIKSAPGVKGVFVASIRRETSRMNEEVYVPRITSYKRGRFPYLMRAAVSRLNVPFPCESAGHSWITYLPNNNLSINYHDFPDIEGKIKSIEFTIREIPPELLDTDPMGTKYTYQSGLET